MRLLVGKWYVAVRFRNDLCIGVGRPSVAFRAEVMRDRPHRGI